MAKWGPLIGGCIPAATVTAIAGGLLLFLGLVGWGIVTGRDGTLAGSIGPTAPGAAYTGFLLWTLVCAVPAFAAALLGAAGALLPLHLMLARHRRTHAAWYAAAGGIGAMLATVVLRPVFAHWAGVFQAEDFDGMLAVAALGGPFGGLVYRQLVS